MTALPQIKQELKVFSRSLKNQGIPVQDIYLFGSAARGESNHWSDIDIGIISEPFGDDRISEMVTLRSLAYPINPAISPVPLRPQELEDKFSTISRAIKKDGIRIVL